MKATRAGWVRVHCAGAGRGNLRGGKRMCYIYDIMDVMFLALPVHIACVHHDELK